MSPLLELQRMFQADVLGAQPSSLATEVVEHPAKPAAVRIAIYRDAYRIRLREALASNYPQLKRWAGDETFDAIADAYIDTYPSHQPSVRWFGDTLAAVLSHSLPAQPWIGELAQWEWLMSLAFDAVDRATLHPGRLAEFSAEQWPELQFEFHPSVHCRTLRTNAPALYKALSEGHTVAAPSHTHEMQWLIWRQDLTPRYRSLDPSEAAALRVVLDDGTFESMCTALCEWYPEQDVPMQAASLLREWLDAQMICSAASR